MQPHRKHVVVDNHITKNIIQQLTPVLKLGNQLFAFILASIHQVHISKLAKLMVLHLMAYTISFIICHSAGAFT
jgi:hypothetical protein